MYSKITKRIAAFMTIAALALSAFAMLVPVTQAATTCNFTRDLSLGIEGEDVRCLQKYLNSSGFTIASSGVGSAGSETNQYKEKTQAAVVKWQSANGIAPATGTFGPKSRAKYTALAGGTTGGSSSPSPAIPSSNSAVTIEARVAILAAVSAYEDAVDEDVDASDLRDIAERLNESFVAFLNGNLSNAVNLAHSAENLADDVMGGGSDSSNDDEGEAEDALDEVKDDFDDAEDVVNEAIDSGASDDDANDALSALDDADEAINDAEDALDDEDWSEVLDLVDDAQNSIDDAYDAIGASRDADENDAEDAISELEDAIDEAWDDFNNAEDNDEDTGDAEDMLDDAENLLDDANDAFDDEDWNEVIDITDEAMNLIDDALDELN